MQTEEYTIPFEGNRYCGPAALAYVMRGSPTEAAALIRKVSGKRKVIGTSNAHLLAAIGHLGMSAHPAMPQQSICNRFYRPLLRHWIDTFEPEPHQEYIVNITGHYIIVHGSRYFDSKCHLGKPLVRCPYLRCRVKLAWRIERPSGEVLP